MNRTANLLPRYVFGSQEIFHLSYNSSRHPFQVHKFNRTSTKFAVKIEVYVFETKHLEWKLLLDFGRRPTLERFQLAWSVDNATGGKTPHSFFILPNKLPGTGEFYLGIAPLLTKQLLEEWKNGTFNFSYALVIYETSCRHWDEMLSTWSVGQCKVIS